MSVLRVTFLSHGMQLLSAGTDGLLKLWTIKTNDCVGTFDGHDDRVRFPGWGRHDPRRGALTRVDSWSGSTDLGGGGQAGRVGHRLGRRRLGGAGVA